MLLTGFYGILRDTDALVMFVSYSETLGSINGQSGAPRACILVFPGTYLLN